MMFKYTAILLGSLLLAGCTTPEQKAASMQAEMDRLMRSYGPACEKLGYPAGTDPWRNCVLQLSARDDSRYYGHPAWYGGYSRSRWSLGGYWGW